MSHPKILVIANDATTPKPHRVRVAGSDVHRPKVNANNKTAALNVALNSCIVRSISCEASFDLILILMLVLPTLTSVMMLVFQHY